MVYKRYYSPFEDSCRRPVQPLPEQNKPEPPPPPPCKPKQSNPFGFFEKIGYDDLIIIGLLVVLLMEDKENRDIPLILALGFLFLISFIDAD